MAAAASASPNLARKVLVAFGLAVAALMLMLFVPAGTVRYWQAWAYLVVLFVPLTFALAYLLRHEPDLLERRLRVREREPQQRRVIAVSWVLFLAAFLIPGLDHRFGWSHVPPALVLTADALVLAGYVTVIQVFRENRYASRIVEVEAGQKVISTGPYAVIRHPMYVGALLMWALSPLALGSYWAVLPMLPIVWVIVARIGNEEQVLARDLPGYSQYMQKVRHRLIPGVW